MVVCQVLIGLIVLNGFFIWGSSHELWIAVVSLVAHKNSGFPEYILWVSATVALCMIPGWEYIIWKIDDMSPGLVSKVFLIYPPEYLLLVIFGLLWYFPNSLESQGGGSDLVDIPGVLFPYWIILWFILTYNGSACDSKPGSTSRAISKGPWLTISGTCSILWHWLQTHHFTLPPSCWRVGMVSQLELEGLLPHLRYLFGPKS